MYFSITVSGREQSGCGFDGSRDGRRLFFFFLREVRNRLFGNHVVQPLAQQIGVETLKKGRKKTYSTLPIADNTQIVWPKRIKFKLKESTLSTKIIQRGTHVEKRKLISLQGWISLPWYGFSDIIQERKTVPFFFFSVLPSVFGTKAPCSERKDEKEHFSDLKALLYNQSFSSKIVTNCLNRGIKISGVITSGQPKLKFCFVFQMVKILSSFCFVLLPEKPEL